jgi:deoxycytidine triphosphate deaminase
MVISELNLKELMEQYDIAPMTCFDQFSISLHLGTKVCNYHFPDNYIVTYGERITDEQVSTIELADEYILHSGQAILACSSEKIKMPAGYIGFLQTKGSLARLFVTAHCCDGQIEPGFEGHVTLEICNMGPLDVRLLPNAPIAQMFIFKTSSDQQRYQGKYNNSDKPTYSK